MTNLNDYSISITPAKIASNSEELKIALAEKMQEYETAVFTEDSKQIAKSELASLRKLRESVERRRKDIKAVVMQPYTDFEKEVKELVAIIDKPIGLINDQLKEMEEKRIQQKREDILQAYDEIVGGNEYITFERAYDKKWENATVSLKKVRETLTDLIEKINKDIEIIKGTDSDVIENAIEVYTRSGDVTVAMDYINAYERNKKIALERERERIRREEEAKRQEEIERAKREERERIERERLDALMKEVEEANALEEEEDDEPFIVPEEENLPFIQPNTVTAFYRVVATPEELEAVEMAFNSIGIYFTRRLEGE